MAKDPTPEQWAATVLKGLGIHQTPGAMQAMVGWARAEGGHWNNDARYNPLNTTQPMPGAGNTGTQGNIKVYKSWQQGVDATVKTLKNGYYGGILSALKAGNAGQVGQAIGQTPWGTGGGLVQRTIADTPPIAGAQPLPLGKVKAPKTAPAQPTVPQPYGTVATPGVDNSAARNQAVLGYVQQGGVNNSAATLALAGQAASLRDTPGTPAVYATSRSTPGSATPTKKVKNTTKNSGLAGVKNPNVMELFWNGQNAQNWDEGDFRPQGYVSGHTDHVHVSAGPNTILALGKEAQDMGLNVGENPAFGGVTPVHADGSFHYRNAKAKGGQTVGEGIDVSGDPAKMAAFAKLVAKLIRAGAGKNKK